MDHLIRFIMVLGLFLVHFSFKFSVWFHVVDTAGYASVFDCTLNTHYCIVSCHTVFSCVRSIGIHASKCQLPSGTKLVLTNTAPLSNTSAAKNSKPFPVTHWGCLHLVNLIAWCQYHCHWKFYNDGCIHIIWKSYKFTILQTLSQISTADKNQYLTAARW